MKKIVILLLALSYSVQSLCIPGLKKAMAKPMGLEAVLKEKSNIAYKQEQSKPVDINPIEIPSLPQELIIKTLLEYRNLFENRSSNSSIELALSLINNFPDYTDDILISLFKNPNVELDDFDSIAKTFCNTRQLKGITSFNSLMQNQIIQDIKTDQQNINDLNKAFRFKKTYESELNITIDDDYNISVNEEFQLDQLNSQIAVNNTNLMKKSQQEFKSLNDEAYEFTRNIIKIKLQEKLNKPINDETIDNIMKFLIEKTILSKLFISKASSVAYIVLSVKRRLHLILLGRFITIIEQNFEL